MARIKEQAHFKNVPKDIILHAIEAISESLIQDAKYNYGNEYGFKSQMSVNEKGGTVFTEVKFIPYDYKFHWLIAPEEDGYLVTLIASTPGRWHEFLYNAPDKLKGLVDTQWAALMNFGIGFVTADYYLKAKRLHGKEHVVRAKEKVKHKKKEEHKPTKID